MKNKFYLKAVTVSIILSSFGTVFSQTLSVTVTKTNASNCSVCDGSATANPTGGTPPYTYNWIAGTVLPKTQTVTGLCSGPVAIQLVVVDAAFAFDTASVTIGCPNGIADNYSENNITVFSNPFSTQATFSLSKEVKDGLLVIYNIVGKEIRAINFSGDQIIVEKENISNGIYFYKIFTDNKALATGKFIIQ